MTPQRFRPGWRLALALVFVSTLAGDAANHEILPPGFRPLPVGVHALVGGRVVVKPGETTEDATVVIRDGIIKSVGKEVSVPADARVWDMKGLTIYAGFIDAYMPLAASEPPAAAPAVESSIFETLTAGGVSFFGVPGQRTDRGAPGPGYEIARITPEQRAVNAYSPNGKTLTPLRELGFTAGIIAPANGIIRGTSALVALVEDNPNRIILKPDVFQHVSLEPRGEEVRAYPASRMGVIATVRQSFFDAEHYALDQADYTKQPGVRARPEFNLSLEALAPAASGRMPVMIEPGSALMVDRAARIAAELKLSLALVASGQEWRRPDLMKGIGATFVVPLNFPALPRLPGEEDWHDVSLDQLRAWDWAAENPAVLRQQGREIALTTHGLGDKKSFRKNLKLALERGLSEEDALAALTVVPAKLCGVEKQLGTIEAGKIANLTVVEDKGYFDPESRVRDVWIDGRHFHIADAKEPPKEPKKDDAADAEKTAKAKADKEKKEVELKELRTKRVARSPLEGRGPIPVKVGDSNVTGGFITGATIWTCGSAGRMTNANLYFREGKIFSVNGEGTGSSGPLIKWIDGTGLHITPGLIDAHSHAAILGEVNEGTLPSSAMVRISDVVNSETRNLSDQLAGGLTVANLLHGSANPIGGQTQIIKLRDGASPEELKFEGAPPGIKFALGENVKQSNAGERNTTRFPQTRMGVRTFHANRFTAAQSYLKDWETFRRIGGLQPRRDLELETIGEIIQGKRWIHCHSYRQDEILAFLRTMEAFNVKIGTLQHILEGYKLADEIAVHGAGASSFADWWAYKFEVYDAIPHNGSLMRDRGVLVSFNSDSPDLARRMNTEAAKAVKFGGTPEIEALKFVTINPAKQLRIDSRVGSLEPGKDADFVVWSGPPLDSRSVVLQTWIDGKKYFDRSVAAERAAALAKEREDLIAKVKKLARPGGGGGGEGEKDDGAFWRVALEHQFDGVNRHCLDEEEGR
jgi:imidazolonepropionase-like amidohydrolase